MKNYYLLFLLFIFSSKGFSQGKIVLHYESDKNKPFSSCAKTIDSLIDVLKKDTTLKANITGHSDNTGDGRYNMDLSNRRANDIYTILCSKGISINRISYLGLGPYKPIKDNKTEENRQLNRRVEIELFRKPCQCKICTARRLRKEQIISSKNQDQIIINSK